MSNHLQTETSPYLLEHAENPVDWYPWGEEALEKARREDKPIFLSIGYAACHWCHVMARESFEDPEIASYLNNHFVSIKVDREERPDLDTIYMNAVVTITGQGGWPMSVFLSPDARPFFGGTYFPPTPRYGMPSFRQVLESIVESWTTERAQIDDIAKQLSDHLRASDALKGSSSPLQENTLGQAAQTLISSYDRVLFVDAHTGRVPEEIHLSEVNSEYQTSPFTHHMTPATCVALSSTLFGKGPSASLVSIRGYEFGFSRNLSPATAALIPTAVDQILDWLDEGLSTRK